MNYASLAGSATVTRFPGTSCAYATTYAYTSSKLTGISVPSASASWSVAYTTPTEMTVRNTSGGTTPAMQRVLAWNSTTRDATVTTFDGQTRYAWNPTGTTRLSSNEGSATLLSTYTYDGQNLLTRQVSPTGRETSQTYDSRGNTIFQWDEAGRITSFVYDANDNPVRETDPKGATAWRTFDACGNVTAEEKTLTASGQRSRTEYTYDSAGRTTSTRSKIDDTNWAKTDYSGFADNGEATTIIDRSVKLSPTATAVDLTRRATYDKFGSQLTETDAANVVAALNTYDIAGR
ncbi:MAG: hypothetical protein U1E22_03650, partial [Coriobacteriia bacterium]|nr:hypothetical protein [Coriobacteriia bacterium]